MTNVQTASTESHTGSLVLTWVLLVALTLASVWFRDHGLGPAAALTAILVITFVKVYMIGHTFMEIGSGPPLLKLAFGVWCAGTCALLVVLAFAL